MGGCSGAVGVSYVRGADWVAGAVAGDAAGDRTGGLRAGLAERRGGDGFAVPAVEVASGCDRGPGVAVGTVCLERGGYMSLAKMAALAMNVAIDVVREVLVDKMTGRRGK